MKIKKINNYSITFVTILFFICNTLISSSENSVCIIKNNINQLEEKNLSINNWGVAEYYYHNIFLEKNLTYLFDYLNYRIGIYNLTDITNPKFIYDYSLLVQQNSTNRKSLFYDNGILDIINNTFYLYGFSIINNSKYINFYLMELQNYSKEIILYETKIKINTSLYGTTYFRYKNKILYAAISEYNVNYSENSSFFNLTLLKFNLTNPYNPFLESNQHILTDSNKTINKLTNPSNICFFGDNILYLYREFQNRSTVLHRTDLEDDFAYGNLRIIKIEDNLIPEVCSEINFTRGAFPSFILNNGILFHSIRNYGFDVYNCTNPYQPIKISEYNNGLTIWRYLISSNLMYLSNSDIFEILDISNLVKIKKLDRYNPRKISFIRGMLKNNYFIMTKEASDVNQVFIIFDCTNPNRIKLIYPEGVISEYRFAYMLFLPIFVPILTFSIITIVLLRKKRN